MLWFSVSLTKGVGTVYHVASKRAMNSRLQQLFGDAHEVQFAQEVSLLQNR